MNPNSTIQNFVNWFVRLLIHQFARIAGKDPYDWLVSIADSAELDQDGFNKLVELI